MKLNITRGRVARPQKIVIYAPEGIGKTTLAAACPSPLILDFEEGSHHLDVARVEPESYKEALAVLAELAKGSEFKTVIIDTMDWLEKKLLEQICKDHGKSSIEEFGYGKGYVIAAEEALKLLTLIDRVAEKSDVILLAHSEAKKFEAPDQPPYDKYQLKLSKQIAPLVMEWADALLFGNYKMAVKVTGRGETEKAKAVGVKERQLYCNKAPTADAKNRHGLRDIEPWGMETLGKILGASALVLPAAPGAPGEAEAADHVPGLEAPAETWRDEFLRTLGPYEDQVIGFLVNRKQIAEGGSLRDVTEQYARRVLENPLAFLKAAGVKEVQS
jgi:hypothetical protein